MPNIRKYSWETWFARRRVTLRRGIDYDCSSISMAQQVRNVAHQKGYAAHIADLDGTLEVVFVRKKKLVEV